MSTSRRWAAPLGLCLLCLCLAACAGEPRSFAQLLKATRSQDAAARSAAIERYVQARGGTPLVENNARLIFVARAVEGRFPRITGDFNGWAASGQDAAAGTMTPIEGTDWAYLEATAFTNARVEYVLLFDKEARTDPLNPRTVEEYPQPRSEIRMPFWQAQPEIDDTAAVPAGTLTEETLVSRALGGPRRVWYYQPPGYDASTDVYPTVYVLDGGSYAERLGAAHLLDRLIVAKAVPPLVAVFSEPGDRDEEYSRNPRWRQFVTGELVPAVDKRFRTIPAPDQRAVLGSSLAAYGAVDLAIEVPGTFGLCAALAPPAQTATIVTNQAAGAARAQAVRFFVLAGTYDPMADGARRLRTALTSAHAALVYTEVPEGHNSETFRGRFGDALAALFQEPAAQ